jgi:hypothetical protein
LANAVAIFLIATSSPVSLFMAELQVKKEDLMFNFLVLSEVKRIK